MHAEHIFTFVVLLVALESASSQEPGVTIHITGGGPVRLIVGSQTGLEGQFAVAGIEHVQGLSAEQCPSEEVSVSTANQCIGEDGFCLETGDRCDGTTKILQNSCNDECSCCVPDKPECPDGFVMSSGSAQCFKIFKDEKRSWEEAKALCEAERLIMAKPSDAVAVALRKDLLDTYGNGYVWLDARGDGTKLVWQRNQIELRSDSPLWGPGNPEPDVTTRHCLGMAVWDSYWSRYPEQPYYSYPCSKPSLYTLCEVTTE